jgi:hypothetical protein
MSNLQPRSHPISIYQTAVFSRVYTFALISRCTKASMTAANARRISTLMGSTSDSWKNIRPLLTRTGVVSPVFWRMRHDRFSHSVFTPRTSLFFRGFSLVTVAFSRSPSGFRKLSLHHRSFQTRSLIAVVLFRYPFGSAICLLP